MIVLIDMDGPLADFEAGFLTAWRNAYPDRTHIPSSKRVSESLLHDYPAEYKEDILNIMHTEGFYANLPITIGAVSAISEMTAAGFDIFVTTSAKFQNPFSYSEKRVWLARHFGDAIARRMIITKDKTLIRGDVLIDDRASNMNGLLKPVWKLFLFDEPHNRNITGFPRLTWDNWQDVLMDRV